MDHGFYFTVIALWLCFIWGERMGVELHEYDTPFPPLTKISNPMGHTSDVSPNQMDYRIKTGPINI